MQGTKPCGNCPYGYKCNTCPEDLAENDSTSAFGWYSQEIRIVIDKDGNKHYTYSHPE